MTKTIGGNGTKCRSIEIERWIVAEEYHTKTVVIMIFLIPAYTKV